MPHSVLGVLVSLQPGPCSLESYCPDAPLPPIILPDLQCRSVLAETWAKSLRLHGRSCLSDTTLRPSGHKLPSTLHGVA